MFSPERYVKWTDENRGRLRGYQRQYYLEHYVRIRARQNKMSRKHGPSAREYKRMLVNVLLDRDGFTCAVCNVAMEDCADMSIDHIVPKMLGGSDEAGNIRVIHKQCNSTRARGHRTWKGMPIG